MTTVVVFEARLVNAAAEEELTEAVMETVWLPSTKSSSTEVRVTNCGVFQLDGVKVKLFTPTVASVISRLCISKITLVKGAFVSTRETVVVAGLPSDRSPAAGLMVNPGVSSSATEIT